MDIIKRFKRTRSIASTMQREEGLTLIEVLAVVVILGIVAAIAVPSVTKAIDQAKVNSTETTLGTLQSALQRYYFDEGEYPKNLTFLTKVMDSTGTANGTSSNPQSAWQGPYIQSSVPVDDAWGNPIYYGYVSDGSGTVSGYVLLSGDGQSVDVDASTLRVQMGTSAKTQYMVAAGGGQAGSSSYALPPTLVNDITATSTGATASTADTTANSVITAADNLSGQLGTFTDN